MPSPFSLFSLSFTNDEVFDLEIGGKSTRVCGLVPNNLKDWFYLTFGSGMADMYAVRYNEKSWIEVYPDLTEEMIEHILRNSCHFFESKS